MSIVCKYLLTAGLREQNINVTQLWPGILKFSQKREKKGIKPLIIQEAVKHKNNGLDITNRLS